MGLAPLSVSASTTVRLTRCLAAQLWPEGRLGLGRGNHREVENRESSALLRDQAKYSPSRLE